MAREESLGEPVVVDEWQSKRRLCDEGVAVPEGRLCEPDGVMDAAREIGGRVVLKGVSDSLTHKSESGAVFVGLESEGEIRDATSKLSAIADHVLVEQMIEGPIVELIVGVSRDPTFGLSLLIGMGGTLVELVDETVSLLLPASRDDILRALSSLTAHTLMNGYRGGDAADINAVVDTIAAIAGYAEANADSLHELDVNPLIVTAEGATAVDAVIRKTEG